MLSARKEYGWWPRRWRRVSSSPPPPSCNQPNSSGAQQREREKVLSTKVRAIGWQMKKPQRAERVVVSPSEWTLYQPSRLSCSSSASRGPNEQIPVYTSCPANPPPPPLLSHPPPLPPPTRVSTCRHSRHPPLRHNRSPLHSKRFNNRHHSQGTCPQGSISTCKCGLDRACVRPADAMSTGDKASIGQVPTTWRGGG